MRRLMWLFVMSVLAVSCEYDDQADPGVIPETTSETIRIQSEGNANARTTETGINCGESEPLSIMWNGIEVGSGVVSVDSSNVNILLDLTSNEWFILDIAIFVGDCNAIPGESAYPYVDSYTTDDEIRSYERNIPLDSAIECGCIRIVATIARFNSSTSQIESFTFRFGTDYCSCEEPEEPQEPDDKDLRTQTQGGWGAPPHGQNPGAYLHENFDDAFPGGLAVGCTYTITLTDAQAVTDFLPQGGKAAALTKSYIDPTNVPKSTSNPMNVLAGQVVALTLSVNFDLWDEDFGESSTNLINAVITEGTFEGWTVGEVLEEAEKVLGGCASSYTPAQMNEVVTAINESYVDGNKTSDFLENGV